MSNGAVMTNSGVIVIFHRGFTASPTITAPTRFKIGTGTTTPAITDSNLDTPIVAWNAASDYKNYVVDYPVFGTVSDTVTVRGFIGASQANGNVVTEYADFNTDATPMCCSRQVFTGITKSNEVQVYVTTTYMRE